MRDSREESGTGPWRAESHPAGSREPREGFKPGRRMILCMWGRAKLEVGSCKAHEVDERSKRWKSGGRIGGVGLLQS